MKYTLVGQIPRHIYCFVDSKYTHKQPIGFIPAVWFALVSYPGRVWGCTVMLESGCVYRNIPSHAIAFSDKPEPVWGPSDAQTWNCYGLGFSAIQYDYLSGLDCLVRANGKELLGVYLFTVAPVGDGFSAYPEQAKEFTFVQLKNGRLTVQPTNHIVFRERSFTSGELSFPSGLCRQTEIWSAE
jgi:hypothetical protein